MAVDVKHKNVIPSVADGVFRINDTKLRYCSVYYQHACGLFTRSYIRYTVVRHYLRGTGGFLLIF